MGSYNEEYKKYYEKIQRKVKVKNDVEKYGENIEENRIKPECITSRYPGYTQGNYKGYSGNYNRYIDNSRYSNSRSKKTYIDKFILQLAITAMLFLSVFMVKLLPYDSAKKIYNDCKSIVNYNFNYDNFTITMKDFGESLKKGLDDGVKKIETLNLNNR